jgi:transposase
MEQDITVVGLDVSKKMLVTGVLPLHRDRISESKAIPNDPPAIEREVRRLAAQGPVIFVYEAGPCGYEIHRQIVRMGHRCAVIAPGLIPSRPTDRVKTDRRDAEKLARLYRAGELTEIRIPSREEESARDLTRVREDVLTDRLRARHRLSKFLLRQGRVFGPSRAWGVAHQIWLKRQRFEWEPLQQTFEACVRACEEAQARLDTLDSQVEDLAQRKPYRTVVRHLRCLKGVDTLGALTMAVEAQDFRRFETAASFMGFTGLVSSEHSSGEKIWRGGITKAGNAHLRRVLVEAAWCNRHHTVVSRELALRRKGCPAQVLQIARRAQDRLHRKYWRMVSRTKHPSVAVAAVARELAGFVWAIGRQVPCRVAA